MLCRLIFSKRHKNKFWVAALSCYVKPSIGNASNGRSYTFQQHSSPCHTSKCTQTYLIIGVRPLNSPDCNQLDYFFSGVCEASGQWSEKNQQRWVTPSNNWVLPQYLQKSCHQSLQVLPQPPWSSRPSKWWPHWIISTLIASYNMVL